MSRRRTVLTVVLAVVGLFGVFGLGITGWIVWDVVGRHGVSSGDKSAYAKCNGLDKLVQPTIRTIAATYALIDKRYVCRAIRGNTPQRVTQITYTYAAAPNTEKPTLSLSGYLDSELSKGGWVTPGVEAINGHFTPLHLTNEPLIGMSFYVVPSPTPIFQIVAYARDQWQPPAQDEQPPKALVASNATIRTYNPGEYEPTFVPAGYVRWQREPAAHTDEFDVYSLTRTTYNLAGGDGKTTVEVYLTSVDENRMDQMCGVDECVEVGKNTEGKAIYATTDGNGIYTQLGETFVEIDQGAKYPGKPPVGFPAGLPILASMQPAS
jgi:hypothetical protein